MKTTLLTGISGYIGLHCAKQLLEVTTFFAMLRQQPTIHGRSTNIRGIWRVFGAKLTLQPYDLRECLDERAVHFFFMRVGVTRQEV